MGKVGGIIVMIYTQLKDESMRVGEGGGNVHEGEFIVTEFLGIDEIRELLRMPTVVGPPSMLLALQWWLYEIYPTIN